MKKTLIIFGFIISFNLFSMENSTENFGPKNKDEIPSSSLKDLKDNLDKLFELLEEPKHWNPVITPEQVHENTPIEQLIQRKVAIENLFLNNRVLSRQKEELCNELTWLEKRIKKEISKQPE